MTDLLRRIRWANLARLAAVLAALGLVLAWPRLHADAEPALPPDLGPAQTPTTALADEGGATTATAAPEDDAPQVPRAREAPKDDDAGRASPRGAAVATARGRSASARSAHAAAKRRHRARPKKRRRRRPTHGAPSAAPAPAPPAPSIPRPAASSPPPPAPGTEFRP